MATLKVKFISTVYLKENTTIEDNVDDTKLVPYIYSSQDTHIQQALGTNFYNRLKSGVTNNDLTTLEEDFLRDYVQPALAQWAFYEVFPFLNYKSTNKAVSKESSEFSQPSELDEIKYLRNSIRDLAEFYLRRINQYLCDFGHLFPEYQNPDPYENVVANSKSYFSGLYLHRRGRELFKDYPTYYGDRYDCREGGGC
jgi:hypothetical protein